MGVTLDNFPITIQFGGCRLRLFGIDWLSLHAGAHEECVEHWDKRNQRQAHDDHNKNWDHNFAIVENLLQH